MSKKNDLTAGSTFLNLDQIANAVLHRLKGQISRSARPLH